MGSKGYKGLTDAEVRRRMALGQVNVSKSKHQRTIGQIVRSHTITYFNVLNYIFALLVIISGQIKNVLFIGVVVCNSVIGIFQEIRVKQLIDKLSVVTAAKARVYRNGKLKTIGVEKIVVDDIIALRPGDQIATDGIVLESDGIEVNESMLTGESKPVKKAPGDPILAGSFITAGTGVQKVEKVGDDTYASSIVLKAKAKHRATSEMQNTINHIIKFISIIIIPLGIFFLRSQYIAAGGNWSDALVKTVSGLIGMIPEGLVLLTSVSFIIGVGRLAMKRALVQEMEAIEALARVNILCTDKTGTITTGELEVVDVVPFAKLSAEDIKNILSHINGTFEDANATQDALNKYFGNKKEWEVTDKIPFSSSRKYRAVSFKEHGSFVLGAAEMLIKDSPRLLKLLNRYSEEGYRVLLLGDAGNISSANDSVGTVKPVAIIVISDIIKTDAMDTFKYFAKEDVQIKVLSGDNPVTVSTVAKKAGVEGAEKYIDASTLPADPGEFTEAIKGYNIFGRVKPEQKQAFVRAWQDQKNTVAMVGDGVNDVLAIKDADCGIAMASGSDAAKQAAHIVLLDSDFASMKDIVKEGRQIIANIERVSSLYLTKTIYSMVLVIIFMLLRQDYPFTTLQMGLINIIGIGMPSFLLTLEQQETPVSHGFLMHVLKIALPSALTMVSTVMLITILNALFGWSGEVYSTFVLVLGGFIAILIVFEICTPMNKYHWFVVAMSIITFLAGLLLLPDFYDIHVLAMWWSLLMIPIGVLVCMLIYWYSRLANRFVQWFFVDRKIAKTARKDLDDIDRQYNIGDISKIAGIDESTLYTYDEDEDKDAFLDFNKIDSDVPPVKSETRHESSDTLSDENKEMDFHPGDRSDENKGQNIHGIADFSESEENTSDDISPDNDNENSYENYNADKEIDSSGNENTDIYSMLH